MSHEGVARLYEEYKQQRDTLSINVGKLQEKNNELNSKLLDVEMSLKSAKFLVEHYNNSFKVHYERAEKAESKICAASGWANKQRNRFKGQVTVKIIRADLSELETALKSEEEKKA